MRIKPALLHLLRACRVAAVRRSRAGAADAGDAAAADRAARPRTAPAIARRMPPNGAAATPEGSTVGRPSSEPLGDKLAKSDGVLCPPSGVDPEMRAPTPDTGKMPVIPPPGSPGGDPTVPAEISRACAR